MPLLKYSLLAIFFVASYALQAQEIKWLTWEQAAAANEKKPKKIFVDVYTDWCGWCKRMDVTTFKDPSVVALMNEEFYAVKLNAEQKESINWKGQEFTWLPGGRSGYHKLAYDLLDGRLSFPTFVMLDSGYSRIAISPGYKEGDALVKELKFAAEEHYKTTTWQQYLSRS